MKKQLFRFLCLLTAAVCLLSGCSVLENMPKPPKVTPYPTEKPAETAQAPVAEQTPVPEPSVDPALHEDADRGTIVRIEPEGAEAYDPENGTVCILRMKWDRVRVDSERNPDAAEKITEALAAREDEWYTGSGSGEYNVYGYNNLLAAAEDDYALMKEYGGDVREYAAERRTRVVRADERILVVQIQTYYYLGGAHGGYDTESLCFDMKTGELIHLNVLSSNPENLQSRLVEEMLRLVEENPDYYEGKLALTEPADYESAFRALLRDGSWYPGTEGFSLTSQLYELGPYASGTTDFLIPYERISDVLDSRWLPEKASEQAELSLLPVASVPEGKLEIVDSVSMGEGGMEVLLYCEGCCRDLSLETVEWMGDYVLPVEQLWYCGSLRNAALQLGLVFPGDLPSLMIRYTDSTGGHELLVSLSGKDGGPLLTERG